MFHTQQQDRDAALCRSLPNVEGYRGCMAAFTLKLCSAKCLFVHVCQCTQGLYALCIAR